MKRIVSVLLTLLVVLTTSGVSAMATGFVIEPENLDMPIAYASERTTAEHQDAGSRSLPSVIGTHERQRLIAFYEQTDDAGVKNGTKLNENYTSADDSTWGGITITEQNTRWEFKVNGRTLAGTLDLSGCTTLTSVVCNANKLTSINVSGCTALTQLNCGTNMIASLNVTGCSALADLDCNRNELTALDLRNSTSLQRLVANNNQLTTLNVNGCTALETVMCGMNNLTSLNVGGCVSLKELRCFNNSLTTLLLNDCAELERLYCYGNRISSLDLSASSSMLYFDCTTNPTLRSIKVYFDDGSSFVLNSIGNGGIGLNKSGLSSVLYAYPVSGADFFGWYNQGASNPSYTDQYVYFSGVQNKVLTAKFSAVGDVNGNGSIDVSDALLVLRHAMGIIQLTGDALLQADANGNGTVELSDALLILRSAVGL